MPLTKVFAEHPLRIRLATVALVTVLILPLVLALKFGSLRVNYFTYWGWAVFSLLMAPELYRLVRDARQSALLRCYALLMVICLFAWEAAYGPGYVSTIPATYILIPVFTAAALAWFNTVGRPGLMISFLTKYLAGTAVFMVFLFTIASRQSYGDETFSYDNPLFFRFIRHINFELFTLLALLLLVIAAKAIRLTSVYLAPLLLLGFFAAWSGGRGGALAMLLLLTLFAVYRKDMHSSLLKVGIALLVGLIVAFLLHQAGVLYAPGLEREGALDATQGLDAVSSGRLGIWKGTLTYWQENWSTIWLGRGSDAFVSFGLNQTVFPAMVVVQPHNAVVQWLLDFGIAGLAVSAAALIRATSLKNAMLENPQTLDVKLAANLLIVVFLIFSLSDGLLFHVAPFTVFLLLVAFRMSRASNF